MYFLAVVGSGGGASSLLMAAENALAEGLLGGATMRKLSASLLAAILMLGATASVAAADSATITIQNAAWLAKGAAVEVTFDIVCEGNPYVQYGYVRVDQRVSANRIASGQEQSWTYSLYTDPMTCDGATVNSFAQVVYSDTGIAFKKGIALVEVYASMSSGVHQTQVEMRVR